MCTTCKSLEKNPREIKTRQQRPAFRCNEGNGAQTPKCTEKSMAIVFIRHVLYCMCSTRASRLNDTEIAINHSLFVSDTHTHSVVRMGRLSVQTKCVAPCPWALYPRWLSARAFAAHAMTMIERFAPDSAPHHPRRKARLDIAYMGLCTVWQLSWTGQKKIFYDAFTSAKMAEKTCR